MSGSPIEPLPLNVVLLNVCRHLTLADLGRASRVSWHWRDVFRRDGAVAHIRAHIVGVLPEWERGIFENSHRYTWYKLERYVAPIPLTLGCHFKGDRREQVMLPLLCMVLSPEHLKRYAGILAIQHRPSDMYYEWGLKAKISADKRFYFSFKADSVQFVSYINNIRASSLAAGVLSNLIHCLLSMGEIAPWRHTFAFDNHINALGQ